MWARSSGGGAAQLSKMLKASRLRPGLVWDRWRATSSAHQAHPTVPGGSLSSSLMMGRLRRTEAAILLCCDTTPSIHEVHGCNPHALAQSKALKCEVAKGELPRCSTPATPSTSLGAHSLQARFASARRRVHAGVRFERGFSPRFVFVALEVVAHLSLRGRYSVFNMATCVSSMRIKAKDTWIHLWRLKKLRDQF